MGRRKQTALEVPETAEEARALMTAYVQAERSILSARLDAELAIDAVVVRRDAIVGELAGVNEQRFAQLKAWWEAGGGKPIADTARSGQLAGARIGVRLTPPRVKFARGVKAEAVIAWLRSVLWPRAGEFLRPKVELDKPAIIRAVQADASVKAMFAERLSVVQEDEFFIDTGLDEQAMRKALVAARADA